MKALELRGVRAGYGAQEVLHGIDLALDSGKCLAILGPNGSGKSTLLRAIAGLLPCAGEIQVGGCALQGQSRARIGRSVAFMSQFASASLPYTVYDTVMLGRYLHTKGGLFARPAQGDHAVVRRCIEATGLAGLERRQVTQLSGGQMQRVFLARALAQEPQVILLDEPTSHLDLRYQAELVDYLRAWAAQGNHAVVGVVHDINLAVRLADALLLLKDGCTVAQGTPECVLTPAQLRAVYGMDVAGYMRAALRRWEDVCNEA